MNGLKTRGLPIKAVVLLTLLLALFLSCENPTSSGSSGDDPAGTTPTTDGDSGGDSSGGSGGDQNTSQFMAMVRVDGGVMRSSRPGSLSAPDGENSTKPVEVSAFSIGTHEVTQRQYIDVMGSDADRANPTYDPDLPSENPPGSELTDEQYAQFVAINEQAASLPIYNVSWYDTIIFANRLSIREGLTPVYAIDGNTNPDDWGAPYGSGGGTFSAESDRDSKWNNHRLTANWSANGYRLPTNAEWSWAAMGGVNRPVDQSAFSGASGSNALGDYTWHSENTPEMTMENPFPVQPVGAKQPNALGIYDMSGNVWEWVWDWHFNWRGGIGRTETETITYAPVNDGPIVTNYRGDFPTSTGDLDTFFDRRRHKIIRGGSVNEASTSRQFAADLDMTSHNAGSSGAPSFQDGNSNTNFGLTFPYVPTERYETTPGNPEGTSVPTQYTGFRVVRNAQ